MTQRDSVTTAGGAQPPPPTPPLVRAIVIMCAATFSMYAFPPAKPASTVSAAASTAGSWRLSLVYLGKHVTLELALEEGGRYVTKANDPYPYKREEGQITFTGDRFVLRADTGRTDSGTFAVTPETLRFRTAAYDMTYTRAHPVAR